MSEPVVASKLQVVDPQAQRIVDFLKDIGLPCENIIAKQDERKIIGDNLPEFIASLDPEIKREARYLSKFVVGAGFGLFDYSLNAIWNEVVLDLRKKAIMYGLDIFFDAAVGGGTTRDFYKSEDDLSSIKDSVLLDACRKLELIADTTHKKLKHILDMRNDIGISHPTNYSINAYELLGWLQICIKDVLNDRPTEAALRVKEFVANLKSRTDPLDGTTQKAVEQAIAQLPSHLCGNLLRTVFGIYVASETAAGVRKNISVIAKRLWDSCLDEPKYKIGIVLEGYKANLHKEKYELGEQFFSVVGGNAYRSSSERAIIVSELITELLDKHNGWDNFHHEAPIAAKLLSYIPEQKAVLPNLAERLFKTVMICRVGNGVSYCHGVSPRGREYYDKILSFAGDAYAPMILGILRHYEIEIRLHNSTCRTQAKKALEVVKTNIINARLIECFDYLIDRIEKSRGCTTSEEFNRLAHEYLG